MASFFPGVLGVKLRSSCLHSNHQTVVFIFYSQLRTTYIRQIICFVLVYKYSPRNVVMTWGDAET